MPFIVTVHRPPKFIRFNVAGPASLQNYFDLIEHAALETSRHGDRLGLVDLRGVVGRLKFTDQFVIGEAVGSKLQHLTRLASLVASDPTSYNSETVANRTGVNLRSFDDEEKALDWLLQEEG